MKFLQQACPEGLLLSPYPLCYFFARECFQGRVYFEKVYIQDQGP